MKYSSIGAAMIAVGLAAPVIAEEPFIDFTPLYKDVVAANPGTEMVHPYIVFVDKDVDGVPEAAIRFNIFPISGNVPLFYTAPKVVSFPSVTCDPASVRYMVGKGKFLGDGNLTRSHIAVVLKSVCEEAGGAEAFRTVVYSASISVPASDPSATVWTRVYPLDLGGFDSDYLSAEGGYAIIVSLFVPRLPTALNPEPSNLRSIGLGIEDGSELFDVTRALSR